MNVLIPFFNLDLFDRFEPQLNALAEEVETLYLLHTRGVEPFSLKENIELVYFELPSRGHKYLNWWIGRKLVSSFVPTDLNVVYSLSGLWMHIYGQEIADFFDIPHVIRMRGNMAEARLYQGRGSVQRWLFYRSWEESFRKATLVTCIVEKFIPYLRTIGLRESQIGEVIPNGIDAISWSPMYPDLFTPGYAGRISEEKGSRFLLDLIKKTPQWTWRLTGDIQDQDFIPPGNCHYLGITSFKDMGEFYDKVSLLVLPSHSEGFPNTILEGYASGKLVLGSLDAVPQEIDIF